MPFFALLDESGVVTNVIVADQDFIDQLPQLIEDEAVDTGTMSYDQAIDVTDMTPRPSPGFALRDGEWIDTRSNDEPAAEGEYVGPLEDQPSDPGAVDPAPEPAPEPAPDPASDGHDDHVHAAAAPTQTTSKK